MMGAPPLRPAFLPPNAEFVPPERYADPCVYFLCADARVMYVGKTLWLACRLAGHLKAGRKFNAVWTIRCSKADLLNLERQWIRICQPEWNVVHTSKCAQFEKIYGYRPSSQELAEWTPPNEGQGNGPN